MNYKEIRELTEWLEKSSFTTYSLTTSVVSISISKQLAFNHHLDCDVKNIPNLPTQPIPTQNNNAYILENHPEENSEKDDEGCMVTSPIVGIYYESASPGSPAFVKVGDKVKKGDVLCILEAMKVMNEITATGDGVVAKIYASNGEMVEACMPLFKIKT